MKPMLFAVAAVAAISAASLIAAASPQYVVQQRYVLGGEGRWDYLTFDAVAQRLYIARGDRVMVVDVRNGKLIGEVPGADVAHRVVIVPERHRGYVSNGHGDSVTPFDLGTLKPLPAIAISGKDPDAMLFDKASARLWTFNGHSNDASVIDPASGKETGSIPLPGKPEFAVTDDHGHIYVNLEDKAQIADIDARAGKVLAVWPLATCEKPTGLAIDAKHRRLFSVCANRQLVVLDANDGHHVATLPIGGSPDAAGYDAGTGTVFSSNGEGSLTVIHQGDADTYAVAADVETAKSARTLAVDEKAHRVFLVAPDVAADGPAGGHGFGMLVIAAQ